MSTLAVPDARQQVATLKSLSDLLPVDHIKTSGLPEILDVLFVFLLLFVKLYADIIILIAYNLI